MIRERYGMVHTLKDDDRWIVWLRAAFAINWWCCSAVPACWAHMLSLLCSSVDLQSINIALHSTHLHKMQISTENSSQSITLRASSFGCHLISEHTGGGGGCGHCKKRSQWKARRSSSWARRKRRNEKWLILAELATVTLVTGCLISVFNCPTESGGSAVHNWRQLIAHHYCCCSGTRSVSH